MIVKYLVDVYLVTKSWYQVREICNLILNEVVETYVKLIPTGSLKSEELILDLGSPIMTIKWLE